MWTYTILHQSCRCLQQRIVYCAALANGERHVNSPAHSRGMANSVSPAPQARCANGKHTIAQRRTLSLCARLFTRQARRLKAMIYDLAPGAPLTLRHTYTSTNTRVRARTHAHAQTAGDQKVRHPCRAQRVHPWRGKVSLPLQFRVRAWSDYRGVGMLFFFI